MTVEWLKCPDRMNIVWNRVLNWGQIEKLLNEVSGHSTPVEFPTELPNLRDFAEIKKGFSLFRASKSSTLIISNHRGTAGGVHEARKRESYYSITQWINHCDDRSFNEAPRPDEYSMEQSFEGRTNWHFYLLAFNGFFVLGGEWKMCDGNIVEYDVKLLRSLH